LWGYGIDVDSRIWPKLSTHPPSAELCLGKNTIRFAGDVGQMLEKSGSKVE
jgi:hypothetical protein